MISSITVNSNKDAENKFRVVFFLHLLVVCSDSISLPQQLCPLLPQLLHGQNVTPGKHCCVRTLILWAGMGKEGGWISAWKRICKPALAMELQQLQQ